MKAISLFAGALCLLLTGQGQASGQDTLKIAVPQRGAWDTSITEIGNRAGIFKKHGVNAELLFTGGGAGALCAVIRGELVAPPVGGEKTPRCSIFTGGPGPRVMA